MHMKPAQIRMSVSFEEFRHMIAAKLEVDPALVVPDASFLEDLLADSIQLVDLMLQFEDDGVAIPIESAWQIQTVADAYRAYLAAVTDAPPGPPASPADPS